MDHFFTPFWTFPGYTTGSFGHVHSPLGSIPVFSSTWLPCQLDPMFLNSLHIAVFLQCDCFCPIHSSLVDWLKILSFLQEPASATLLKACFHSLSCQSFSCSMSIYLLNTYCRPGADLRAAGSISANEPDKIPPSGTSHFRVEDTNVFQRKESICSYEQAPLSLGSQHKS
jgi:hypothetical protein